MRSPSLTPWFLALLAACGGEAQVDKDDTNDTDTDDTTDSDDTVDTVPNTPPGAPEVTIVPASPTSADDLVATTIFEATDPDGDPLSYRYVWLVDGAPRAGLEAATVPASETQRGQTWEVRVRAFDGEDEGPTASASALVLNAPPEVLIGWSNPTPHTDDDLVVDAVLSDADGDALAQTWSWTRDGSATAFTTNTVPAAATTAGQTWTAKLVVSDGQGGVTEDELSVVVENRAPVITNLRILPNPASPSRNLRADFTATDPDGDTLTVGYAWTRNGQPTSIITSVVPSSETSEGDLWQVTVTVDDRKGGTSQATASITVANTAPVLASVAIEPDPPGDNDTLTARIAVNDPDGDALTTTYTWYRDGAVFRTGPGATVASTQTAIGQTWEVAATVSDGTASVGPVLSAPVTIVDRPPSQPTIRLDPTTPIPCDDLVCRIVVPSYDPDGTGVTTQLRWNRNGVRWTGSTLTTYRSGDTIPKAELLPGDTWTCEVIATSGALSTTPETVSGTVPATSSVVETFAIQARAQADVLLVVDDSCSMYEEQALLATAADALLDELDTTGVDYHVGVVTTDMAAAARSGQLVLFDGVRFVTPTTPNRLATLEGMIQVGTAGSADERGLAAMQAALSSPLTGTTNAGFLRSTGGLGVLVLSDENDYSGASIATYESFFLGLRASPDDLVARAIVGPPPSGCSTASSGLRYTDFTAAVGGAWTSICAPGFGLAMAEMGGAVAGLPRVFPLEQLPDGAIQVVAITPGGARVSLVLGRDWTYDALGNQVVLLQRPVSGSTLEVSYTAGCPTSPGPGDTGGDTPVDSDTDSGFVWPFGTGLQPQPTLSAMGLDTGALPDWEVNAEALPSTTSLWGPSSFP